MNEVAGALAEAEAAETGGGEVSTLEDGFVSSSELDCAASLCSNT